MPKNKTIKTLGRYNLVSKIGEGGMGLVYKAFDPVLERSVALKFGKLSSMGISESIKEDLDQSLAEARLAAQFVHPNIAIIHDAGFEKELFYMAIEYIEGKGLEKHNRNPNLLPRKQVLEIIFNTCHALDYIHNKGYAHLDIKPSNIMLTSMGEVKLMDFGIARLLKEKKKESKTIAGSINYMSPEQTDPNAVLNHQADIYSLGVVLYELLSGRRPFEGSDMYQIIYKMTNEKPCPIEKYIPDIPHSLQYIIEKSIQKDSSIRFKTAKEFADAILPIIKGQDSKTLDKQDKKKITLLKRLIFFQHFQYSDLMDAINISSWSSHKKNTCIAEASDNDRNIYIIIEGRASLHHLNKVVKVFNAGDCFGESALLYNMPRKARVIADTDCTVMVLNGNLLNQAKDSLQLNFLKEFYKTKLQQLVETNLKLIQAESRSVSPELQNKEEGRYSMNESGLILTGLGR